MLESPCAGEPAARDGYSLRGCPLALGVAPRSGSGQCSVQHRRVCTFPCSSLGLSICSLHLPHTPNPALTMGTHPTPGSYRGSFCSSWLMKSLACWEMSEKISSSNSHRAAVILLSVSMSFSPWKGDSPLSLKREQRTSGTAQPLPEQLLSPGVHSQDITDDTDAPHVCGKPHRLKGDHFWSHELRSSMQHLHRGVRSCRGDGAHGQAAPLQPS